MVNTLANITDCGLSRHIVIGSVLYEWRVKSEQVAHIRFGVSGDKKTFRGRVNLLLDRTGQEMYQQLLPPSNNNLCGACHEIRPMTCGSASRCENGFLNKHCLHTDYAA